MLNLNLIELESKEEKAYFWIKGWLRKGDAEWNKIRKEFEERYGRYPSGRNDIRKLTQAPNYSKVREKETLSLNRLRAIRRQIEQEKNNAELEPD